MLSKIETFTLIENHLLDNGIEADQASELADSIVEILDEEGFFEVETSDVEF